MTGFFVVVCWEMARVFNSCRRYEQPVAWKWAVNEVTCWEKLRFWGLICSMCPFYKDIFFASQITSVNFPRSVAGLVISVIHWLQLHTCDNKLLFLVIHDRYKSYCMWFCSLELIDQTIKACRLSSEAPANYIFLSINRLRKSQVKQIAHLFLYSSDMNETQWLPESKETLQL